MSGETISWRCKNMDCEAENLVDRELVENALEKGKKVTLICGNCGFVNNPEKIEEDVQKTWLACIPFTGSERKLPTGRTPDGWKDYKGNPFSRVDFIRKYKVDPEINWEWRKRGSPKAKE